MADKTEKTREIQADTAPEKTVKKAAKGETADQTESRAGKAGKAGKTGKAVKSWKAGSAEKKKKTDKAGRGAKKTVTEKMTIEERLQGILPLLDARYGTDLKTYLHYNKEKPWQLLFSTILSAQCTDARVNMVTKDLFVKYPELEDFAKADLREMEEDIHSTGFYHHKAKSLIGAAQKLLSDYDGQLPSSIEDLTSLPGVGRKTANVVRGNVFGQASIVVDTHVKRVTNRLGLTDQTDPVKVEFDLYEVLPEDHWILINLQGIALGREICKAPKPRCGECFLTEYCRYYQNLEEDT